MVGRRAAALALAGFLAAAAVRAGADLTKLSLFGGEITADSVVVRANAFVAGSSGSASFGFSSVANLSVLGLTISPQPHQRIALGDWGHAFLLEEEQTALK